MILIVIFSFNRAMQLDYLIKSILNRFKSPGYKISIIYHTTGEHAGGYNKLKNKYKDFANISFLERKPQILGLKFHLPLLYNIKNFKRFVKNTIFFNKKSDNFKWLLEKLLCTTECEYVMFNTDDGYFFDDVEISPGILDLIRSNPSQTSYRLYVGENLDEFPSYLKKVGNEYYTWDYFEHTKITHWTYPFAIDGTIYHTQSILKILRKLFYTNPINLEIIGVNTIIKTKSFSIGLGPITSKLVGTVLNRVSTVTKNPTIQIGTDFLNEKYIEEYELKLELPKIINSVNIVPLKVYLLKDGEYHIIYSFDETGKQVQDAYSIEGSK